jgi:nitrite reductase (NO-forming)
MMGAMKGAFALLGALMMSVACAPEATRGGFGELPASVPPAPSPSQPSTSDPSLVRVSAPGMRFEPAILELQAGGATELELANHDSEDHTLVVSDLAVAILAGAGQTVRSTVIVDRRNRGRFPFFCSIPGHREAGMEGTIEVR